MQRYVPRSVACGLPSWRDEYRDAMHRHRAPGWLVMMVLFAHLASCEHIWGPWAARVRHGAPRPWVPPHPAPDRDGTCAATGGEGCTAGAPPAAEGGGETPAGQLTWAEILAMDPISMAGHALQWAADGEDAHIMRRHGQGPVGGGRGPAGVGGEQLDSPPGDDTAGPGGGAEGSSEAGGGRGPSAHDAGVLLGAAALSFLMIWLPSAWRGGLGGGTWEMGAGGVACLTAAVSACAGACWAQPEVAPRVATCAAMHLGAQSVVACWYVLATCPGGSPLEGYGNAFAQGLCSLCLGGMLFYISHAAGGGLGAYSTAEFYASHAWGLVGAEAVRALLYAPILAVALG